MAYYKASLLYLACINLEEQTKEDLVSRAHDLSIAALLGETIYNFGELVGAAQISRGNTTADDDPRSYQLQHPLLNVLEDSPHKWLKDMLFVFNAGDIGQYEVLSQRLPEEVRLIAAPSSSSLPLAHPPPFGQPILDNDQDFLRQKICLMALIEAVFKRPRSQRNMSFQTIASETKLPMHEVEHLVMKALRYVLLAYPIRHVPDTCCTTTA